MADRDPETLSAGAASPRPKSGPARLLVLLNAEAGRGNVDQIREGIEKGLEETGARFDFVELTGNVHGRDLTAGARDAGYDLVLVAGGDGTLADAAAGLVGRSVPLGIIPAGTGNIVAQNLGVPLSPREAARAAFFGTPEPYDVGRTDDGRIFLLGAGAGYDADLIRDADRELKRRFGPLAYIFAMFKNLNVKRSRYVVELDGEERIHVHAKTVLVTNVSRTMGSLPLAPDARVDDGKLDVVIFTFAGFFQLLLLFVKALFGVLKQDPRVRFYQARSIRISTSRPIPVQVDGEAVERTTPLSVEVLPGALRIMRPPVRPPIDLAQLAEGALKALRDLQARLSDDATNGPRRT
jgi:diacylglycerol kinase (ATP)